MACSGDDANNSNNVDLTQARSDVQAGKWRVSNFVDSGQNETADFNGYEFDFRQDGTVEATNGTKTYNGTWSITDSSSSGDDSPDSDADFNLFFPVPADDDFEDLNDDWDIVTISNSLIDLIDISGGNGGTDILVFQKI
jgi:hypothetical protein